MKKQCFRNNNQSDLSRNVTDIYWHASKSSVRSNNCGSHPVHNASSLLQWLSKQCKQRLQVSWIHFKKSKSWDYHSLAFTPNINFNWSPKIKNALYKAPIKNWLQHSQDSLRIRPPSLLEVLPRTPPHCKPSKLLRDSKHPIILKGHKAATKIRFLKLKWQRSKQIKTIS